MMHQIIASRVLGRKLKRPAEIHHVDGNGMNNSNDNLVICPSRLYHMLLHKRQAAFDACGNANWMKCRFCKKYDDPTNLVGRKAYYRKKTPIMQHQECENEYVRNRRAALR